MILLTNPLSNEVNFLFYLIVFAASPLYQFSF